MGADVPLLWRRSLRWALCCEGRGPKSPRPGALLESLGFMGFGLELKGLWFQL